MIGKEFKENKQEPILRSEYQQAFKLENLTVDETKESKSSENTASHNLDANVPGVLANTKSEYYSSDDDSHCIGLFSSNVTKNTFDTSNEISDFEAYGKQMSRQESALYKSDFDETQGLSGFQFKAKFQFNLTGKNKKKSA